MSRKEHKKFRKTHSTNLLNYLLKVTINKLIPKSVQKGLMSNINAKLKGEV